MWAQRLSFKPLKHAFGQQPAFRWGVFLAVYAAAYALWLGASSGIRPAAGWVSLLPLGWAAWVILRPTAASTSGRVRQAWRLVGLALCAWLVGGLVGIVYLGGMHEPAPLPSFVDLCRLGGAGLLLAALLAYPMPAAHSSFGRLRILLDIALTSGAIMAFSWLILLRPVVNLLNSTDPVGVLWAVIYPLADFLLLLVWLNVWLVAGAARWRSGLGFLAGGLLCLAVADGATAYRLIRGMVNGPTLFDLATIAGIGCLGLGGLLQQQPPPPSPPDQDRPGRFRIWRRVQALLPLAAAFNLGWYTLLDWRLTGHPDAIGVWATILLGLLVVARQGVVAGEVELWQYAQLVQSAADPAFICGADGRLRLINPAAVTLAGYTTPDELVGQPFTKLLQWDSWDQALQRERLFAEGWSGEAGLKQRDGQRVPVALSLRPVEHRGSLGPALAGIAHDLTLVKQQQASLRAAYDEVAAARSALENLNTQLEQKIEEKTRGLSEANARLAEQFTALQTLDQLKSDFVSLVSHELRAPLTTVSGGIELLLSDPEQLTPHVRESLSLVQTHLQRLGQFVASILDLSALEAGRLPITVEPIALAPVLEVIHSQLTLSPDAGRVRIAVPLNLPLLLADFQALTSVLFHLIDNALKYAREGEILVEAAAEANRVRVWVSDHGPGIPSDLRDKVFEKFERLDVADARAVYGHGLGLYICRRLLQMMDGDIQAGETPGGGARFTFWLPVVETENDE